LQKWYLRWEHINTCIYKLIFALFLFVKTRHLVFKNKVLELILSCINLNKQKEWKLPLPINYFHDCYLWNSLVI
jgi:hypothetical protein